MAAKPQAIVRAVLKEGGGSFCSQAGFTLTDKPQPLFRLLLLTQLLSARIDAGIAVAAARGLHAAGWRDAGRLARSTWDKRVAVLGEAGYTRYDESTATRLAELAELLTKRWSGDLRNLRAEADRDAARERELIQRFKGIGPTGADIFAREVQVVWSEQQPFIDKRAADGARRLGLSAQDLPELVAAGDLAALAGGLVRVEIDAKVRRAVQAAIA